MLKIAMSVLVAACYLAVADAKVSTASTITQTFNYQWAAGASTHWQYQGYQPFDTSMGTLNSVSINLRIDVAPLQQGGGVSYTNSFFTGWNPCQYEFYKAGTLQPAPDNGEIAASWVFNSATDLAQWSNPLYGDGHTYFEATDLAGPYALNATEELVYDYTANLINFSRSSLPTRSQLVPFPAAPVSSPVPEPSTVLLFGVALAGACMARRKKE